jgi:hypothetical protein
MSLSICDNLEKDCLVTVANAAPKFTQREPNEKPSLFADLEPSGPDDRLVE